MTRPPFACPACTSALSPRHEHGIEIDACGGCGGVWFDRGELEAHADQQRRNFGERRVALRFEASGAPSPGPCPRCRTAPLEAGRAGQIKLARCASCHGAFVFAPKPSGDGGAWGALDWLSFPLDAIQFDFDFSDVLDLLGPIDL